jgi:hypothetical protein
MITPHVSPSWAWDLVRIEGAVLPDGHDVHGARLGTVLLRLKIVFHREHGFASGDERLPRALAALHFVAFVCLLLHRCIPLISSP